MAEQADQETKERRCSWCGGLTRSWCGHCKEEIKTRPKRGEMTPEDRMKEIEGMGVCEVPFSLIHERIEELVGRPVFTHELGLNLKGLILEAGDRAEQPTLDAVIALAEDTGKKVIIADEKTAPEEIAEQIKREIEENS